MSSQSIYSVSDFIVDLEPQWHIIYNISVVRGSYCYIKIISKQDNILVCHIMDSGVTPSHVSSFFHRIPEEFSIIDPELIGMEIPFDNVELLTSMRNL